MTIVFSNFGPKIPESHIFGPKFRRFNFLPNLQLGKFEGVDLKYGNSFFQIAAHKYPNKAFLVRNLRIFIFAPNFAT